MTDENTTNWPSILEQTVSNLNARSLQSLGYLRPNQINSRTDDPLIDEARGGYLTNQPTWKQQRNNVTKYKKNSRNSRTLKVGSYVFTQTHKRDSFERGYKLSVSSTMIGMSLKCVSTQM
jgi:hypothetical protein